MPRPGFVLEVDRSTPSVLFWRGENFSLEKLPAGRSRVIYPPEPLKPLDDIDGAIQHALLNPIDQDPLPALLFPGMRLTICFDDVSLPLPKMQKPDTRQRAIEAVGGHRRFGFNFDPSHLAYQGVDYVKFIRLFADRIYNAHMKDVWWGRGDGTVGVFGGHTSFGDARRYWDFRSVGRGLVDFESIIVALNDIDYAGPLSVEWEDSRMDRVHGATESVAFCKRLDFKPATGAFDTAFSRDAK